MAEEHETPRIDQATLEAAVAVAYMAREQQLAAFSEQHDIPDSLKREIEARLEQVRREKAQWDEHHGQSAPE